MWESTSRTSKNPWGNLINLVDFIRLVPRTASGHRLGENLSFCKNMIGHHHLEGRLSRAAVFAARADLRLALISFSLVFVPRPKPFVPDGNITNPAAAASLLPENPIHHPTLVEQQRVKWYGSRVSANYSMICPTSAFYDRTEIPQQHVTIDWANLNRSSRVLWPSSYLSIGSSISGRFNQSSQRLLLAEAMALHNCECQKYTIKISSLVLVVQIL